MPFRLAAVSLACALALVGAAAWLFDMSLAQATLLAPVIVLTVGATVAVLLLWTRIALDPLLRRRRE